LKNLNYKYHILIALPYKFGHINVITLTIALFISTLSYAQTEEAGKRIKINLVKNGQKITIDTLIAPGAPFDYNAFLKEHGLEGEMNLDDDEISNGLNDESTGTIKKKVRIEKENINGSKTVSKKTTYIDGEGKEIRDQVEEVKKTDKDGNEKVKTLVNGKDIKESENVEIEIEEEIKSKKKKRSRKNKRKKKKKKN